MKAFTSSGSAHNLETGRPIISAGEEKPSKRAPEGLTMVKFPFISASYTRSMRLSTMVRFFLSLR
ncbi:MAG: hypothetical protein A4E31_01132 [Methanomassiliicoccales archaeon PtaU1.Bin030]|nr:MAG: hypothetical protein A4E31_01132 [Methanomassiliicoccales archaeon PtaU1.Bin030]